MKILLVFKKKSLQVPKVHIVKQGSVVKSCERFIKII